MPITMLNDLYRPPPTALGRSYGSPVMQPYGGANYQTPLHGPAYGRGKAGGTGLQQTAAKQEVGYLRPQTVARGERADYLTGMGDQYLADPTKAIGMFRGLYDEYARGFAAPQQRDFLNNVRGVAGNVAARFGGNASSEEQRVVGRASDDFSRNLTESLSRTAVDAGQAGMQYGNQLVGAGQAARSEQDRLEALLAQYIGQLQQKKQGKDFLGVAGQLAGTAAAVI
jgi:hypothetical protein